MSEIIVGVVVPAVQGDPLVIGGNKSIRLNTLQHTLGKSVDVSKVPQVHDSQVDFRTVNDYDLIVDEDTNTVSIKTPTKTIGLQGCESVDYSKTPIVNTITNFVVPTSWVDLPIALNINSGLYNLLLRVIDSGGNIGYYSATIPFFSEQEQSVSEDSTTALTLVRQGNDESTIQLQLVRTIGATPGTRIQIRGSTTMIAHSELKLSLSRVL